MIVLGHYVGYRCVRRVWLPPGGGDCWLATLLLYMSISFCAGQLIVSNRPACACKLQIRYACALAIKLVQCVVLDNHKPMSVVAVSYTHLTLPTKRIV